MEASMFHQTNHPGPGCLVFFFQIIEIKMKYLLSWSASSLSDHMTDLKASDGYLVHGVIDGFDDVQHGG